MADGSPLRERPDDSEEPVRQQAKALSALLEKAEALRSELRKLSKAARHDTQVHQASVQDGLLFPEALQEFKFGAETDPFVRKWAAAFHTMREMYSHMNSIQGVLFESIETWVSDPLLSLGDLAKQVEADKLLYESALKKYRTKSANPRAGEAAISPLESKLSDARRDYLDSMVTYINRLTEVLSHLRSEFLDRLTSAMYAAESYFTTGGELMKGLAPAMAEKRALLDKERAAYVDKLTSWAVRVFQIKEDGLLTWSKKKSTKSKVSSINLVLSTAKPLADSKYEHCFEILTPDQSRYVIRASSAAEMTEWLDAFKMIIANGLAQGTSIPTEAEREKTKNELGPDLKLLVEKNPKCAECETGNPTWCSLNLGILICQECSGVHRSLGTHISKVRSLTLDKWDSYSIEIVKQIGNKRSNQYWEYQIPPNHHKPSPESTNPLKQVWITSKYKDRLFAPRVATPISPSVLFQKLFWALAKDDLVTAARVVALGAEVNAHTNPDGKTLMHGSAEEGKALCLAFLIVNGGDWLAKDDMGRIPLHYAAAGGFVECVKQLMARHGEGAVLEKDNEGVTPLDVARNAGHEQVLSILQPPARSPSPTPISASSSSRGTSSSRREIKISGPTPKEVREQQQSKLKRVLSGIQSEDVANAQKQMAEQPPRPSAQPPDETLPKPTVKPFKSNPIDSTPNRLYRPSHAGSRVSQASAPSPSTASEEQKP